MTDGKQLTVNESVAWSMEELLPKLKNNINDNRKTRG